MIIHTVHSSLHRAVNTHHVLSIVLRSSHRLLHHHVHHHRLLHLLLHLHELHLLGRHVPTAHHLHHLLLLQLLLLLLLHLHGHHRVHTSWHTRHTWHTWRHARSLTRHRSHHIVVHHAILRVGKLVFHLRLPGVLGILGHKFTYWIRCVKLVINGFHVCIVRLLSNNLDLRFAKFVVPVSFSTFLREFIG